MHPEAAGAGPRSPPGNKGGMDPDLLARENEALRKKVKFLQHVGGLFRQKIGELFTDAAAKDPNLMKLDAAYRRLVTELPSFDGPSIMLSPGLGPAGTPGGHVSFHDDTSILTGNVPRPTTSEGKYWHEKFCNASRKVKGLITNNQETENQLAEDIRTLQQKLTESDHRCQSLEQTVLHLQPRAAMPPMSPFPPHVGTLPHPHPPPMGSPLPHSPLSPTRLHAAPADPGTAVIIQSMRDDNYQVQAQLNDAMERLRATDAAHHENTALSKQNTLLRTRIARMKEAAKNAKVENSDTVLEMQNNIHTLLASLHEAHAEIASQADHIQNMEETKRSLLADMKQMQQAINVYQRKLQNYEDKQAHITRTEQAKVQNREKETEALQNQVVESEHTVDDLSSRLADLKGQVQQQVDALRQNSYHVELLNMEKLSLAEKVEQMEMLIKERKAFSYILGEVQSRLETAVDDLHSVQSTDTFAARVGELSQMVSNLECLESQLKQKDDILVVKEDEIQKLKAALKALDEAVDQISAVFLQMPRSVEEMEKLVLQRDGFLEKLREIAGEPAVAEVNESVELTLMDGQSRRGRSKSSRSARPDAATLQKAGVPRSLALLASPTSLAAATLEALQEGDDSDEELLKEPPRSASTVGALYENMYGQLSFHPSQPVSGSAAGHGTPGVNGQRSLSPPLRAINGFTSGNAFLSTPRITPVRQSSASATNYLQRREHSPPSGNPQHPDKVAPHLSDAHVLHVFKTFEVEGVMDRDHFKACTLYLGLALTQAAEEFLSSHAELDFPTFRHAITLCS
ncbi:hypothetical protein DIPPA_07512 [Diplonema papillatum]|nr:hypothetical protein DIPPA_07512 [Diplonema papillatum]